ncbi:TnsA endonuclease-like protein [Paenibacillus taihuensis]|uniref:TnsA endonuclease-like protein n=1 Tax=Paenibacillus taihuensis TaxID=1156355 RepID=A0A3D9RPY6_9BACL|nr:TnsA endonuclease N-terminal domain-containing protein [Paenibacillus taihuensis]REE77754.1 TnsA endonuclease-like protein [Paenibacillus taihuensis]
MYTEPLIRKRYGRYGNNHWMVYSFKLKRDVNLFSDLEYDHWILIESDYTIQVFCEQPAEAHIEEDGVSIFDMWIKKVDGDEIFFEIKYEQDLNDEAVAKQISIQKKWCELHGKKHQVRTEKDIRSNEKYLENLKDLLPYVLNNSTIVEIDRYKVLTQLKEGTKTVGELNQELNIGLPRLYEAVACMIYSGDISASLDKEYFGFGTEVRINEKKEQI